MILILEKLFGEIHYPMKSVEHRNFTGKKRWDFKEETKEAGNSALSPERRGKQADFMLHVKYRYHVTWQGTVTWKEKRRQVNFRSFMELLLLMYEAVGHTGEWQEKDGGEEPDACTA